MKAAHRQRTPTDGHTQNLAHRAPVTRLCRSLHRHKMRCTCQLGRLRGDAGAAKGGLKDHLTFLNRFGARKCCSWAVGPSRESWDHLLTHTPPPRNVLIF